MIRRDVRARFRRIVARVDARVDQERAEELAKHQPEPRPRQPRGSAYRRAAQWKVRRPGSAAIPSAGADE
jgi:hypothetical protein